MPLSSEIIAAMDADADGASWLRLSGGPWNCRAVFDLKFIVQEPVGHKDWNDQLRAKPHPLLPYRPQMPSVA